MPAVSAATGTPTYTPLPVHFSPVDPVLLVGTALLVAHAVRRGGFVPYLTELIAFGAGLAAAFVVFGPMGDFLHARIGIAQGLAGFGSFLLVLVVVHAGAQATVGRGIAWMGNRVRGLPPNSLAVADALPAVGVAALLITLIFAVAGVRPYLSSSIIGGQVLAHTGFVQTPVQRLLAAPANTNAKRILESDPP